MTIDAHPCPKEGCAERIPFERMACRAHWFSLPPELRRRVNAAWRSGNLDRVVAVRREVVAFLNGTSKEVDDGTPAGGTEPPAEREIAETMDLHGGEQS